MIVKAFCLHRYALAVAAASAIGVFSGCGPSQTSSAADPARAVPTLSYDTAPARTWRKNSTSGEDLLYISSAPDGYVSVYTWPDATPVENLTGLIDPLGECVDAAGDVFIVAYASQSYQSSVIYEYAHGGSEPIATLSDSGGGYGCSIDPTTGNLAVSNIGDDNNPYGHEYGSVAVYAQAQGNPTIYYSRSEFHFQFCGYDDKGNLYLTAPDESSGEQYDLIRLPRGSGSFELMNLDVKLYYGYGFVPSVQWDGKYVTVSSAANARLGPVSIYRLRISGANAKAVGTTMLSSQKDHPEGQQSWIYGKTITGLNYYHHGTLEVSVWRYPKGGQPTRNSKVGKGAAGYGLVVSPAQP